MPSFQISKRAAADIEEIVALTVKGWGDDQAERYVSGLQTLFDVISSRPMMGRSAAKIRDELRRVEHISHIIFYKTRPAGFVLSAYFIRAGL